MQSDVGKKQPTFRMESLNFVFLGTVISQHLLHTWYLWLLLSSSMPSKASFPNGSDEWFMHHQIEVLCSIPSVFKIRWQHHSLSWKMESSIVSTSKELTTGNERLSLTFSVCSINRAWERTRCKSQCRNGITSSTGTIYLSGSIALTFQYRCRRFWTWTLHKGKVPFTISAVVIEGISGYR